MPHLHHLRLITAAAAIAALTLAGCSSPAPEPTAPEPTTASESPTPTPTPEPEPDPATLHIGDSSLGPIVVDAAGMTVYYYDHDVAGSGVSTCDDNCLSAWPAVHGEADVKVDGITAEVGSIPGNDGQPQLTLEGLPLYYFVTDKAPGDVTGQGKGDVWWVVAPDGSKITG